MKLVGFDRIDRVFSYGEGKASWLSESGANYVIFSDGRTLLVGTTTHLNTNALLVGTHESAEARTNAQRPSLRPCSDSR
ncbi:MAG TPA: hypothetical protein VJ023_13055 [Pyrinomonadaceae bacterium]|nr:hypothetical protein [Pyrinomonadaceae bacterium]